MREFLFCGKRVDNGTWVEGTLIVTTAVKEKTYIVVSCWCEHGKVNDEGFADFNWLNAFEVIPETVGQYTNKKDINGTKIFEYYIVKEGCNGLIGVVVWDDDLATYKLDGFGEGYTIQDAETEWEVIGNKFDNPELLRTPQNDEVKK